MLRSAGFDWLDLCFGSQRLWHSSYIPCVVGAQFIARLVGVLWTLIAQKICARTVLC